MIKVHRNSKGFTLIELLIVIAIIGILAAIAIPAYTGYTKKSKMAGVTSAMGAVKNACVAYFTEKGESATLDLAFANIGGNIGVTIPGQYVKADGTQLNATNANNIVIKVIIANIGSGADDKNITLTGNLGNQAWTWTGNVDASLLPKN
jgi:type IV pilus assembly protein PilA